MTRDDITDAMEALISAITRAGFERARDAIRAYGDEPDPDQADWHPALIDMVDTAVGVAADAAGEGGVDRWLAFGPEPGQSVRWAWKGEPDAEFAGMMLRSVHGVIGTDETKPAYVKALSMALPVMRCTALEYLESVTIKRDPATIAVAEWQEIAPDLDAICAAEACVGRDDETDPWLDEILDRKEWRKHVQGGTSA